MRLGRELERRTRGLPEARLYVWGWQSPLFLYSGLDGVSPDAVMLEVRRNLYDGILEHEVGLAQTMAARSLVEQEPNYAFVSARLLLNILRDELRVRELPLSKIDLGRQDADSQPPRS